MKMFETIDIDKHGYVHISKPEECIDYESTAFEFNFLGKRKKILLRLKSEHVGHAHNKGSEIFNDLKD